MQISEYDKRVIEKYLALERERIVYIENFFILPLILCQKSKEIVYLTNNRFIRKALKICGRKVENAQDALTKGKQFEALQATISILNDKNVACYIFANPKEKSQDNYDEKAIYRMEGKLSFPKMIQDPEKYESEFKVLLGEKYSIDYVKKLAQIPQIIKRGSVFGHEDFESELVNVIAGKRIVIGVPERAVHRIHMYGRCGVFGYAVEDGDTLPSQVQKKLADEGYEKYAVVNHGLWGGDEKLIFHNIILDARTFKEGDVLIIYMNPFCDNHQKLLKEAGAYFFDCTEEFHMTKESRWCFYDYPGHMCQNGYTIISDIIGHFLIQNNFSVKSERKDYRDKYNVVQDYLENVEKNNFEKDLRIYLEEIKKDYLAGNRSEKNGAIIMNCNPFTNGHRYLIEYASEKVDKLFVFVLEEDKSYFRFEDRFELVKRGTMDLENVVVLPSREFMISAYTFPEYFMKDYVEEKGINVTKDLTIFSEIIAPALKIKIRFAGQEPIDRVTALYNENMKKILPQYGIEFCEIPRLEIKGEGVVSASKVRKYLEKREWNVLRQYVPTTTYEYLYKTYGEKSAKVN